jgi:hypothetical protein
MIENGLDDVRLNSEIAGVRGKRSADVMGDPMGQGLAG